MAPFGQSPLCTDTGKHRCRHYWERMSHQASVFIPIFLHMVSQPQISVPELSFFFKVSLDNGLDFFFFCSFLQEEWTIHLYSVQMAITDLVISTPLMEVDFFFFFSSEAGGKNGSNNLWLSFAQSMPTCRDLCSYYLVVTVLIMEGKGERGGIH